MDFFQRPYRNGYLKRAETCFYTNYCQWNNCFLPPNAVRPSFYAMNIGVHLVISAHLNVLRFKYDALINMTDLPCISIPSKVKHYWFFHQSRCFVNRKIVRSLRFRKECKPD